MAGTILLEPQRHAEGSGRLNGVRPRWPEQSETRHPNRHRPMSLNGVRPRWPEQFANDYAAFVHNTDVSMESGLDGRNNGDGPGDGPGLRKVVSMESGLDGRNNPIALPMVIFALVGSQWSPA